MGVLAKNVLEHVGGICVLNPTLVYNNINVLKEYGIPLTNDENNNGYTLLGMSKLKEKLDYLIENGLWSKFNDLPLDKIDLIRGMVIKDNYNNYKICQNQSSYDKIDDTSLNEEEIGIKKL